MAFCGFALIKLPSKTPVFFFQNQLDQRGSFEPGSHQILIKGDLSLVISLETYMINENTLCLYLRDKIFYCPSKCEITKKI